jgi:hypothetical protein
LGRGGQTKGRINPEGRRKYPYHGISFNYQAAPKYEKDGQRANGPEQRPDSAPSADGGSNVWAVRNGKTARICLQILIKRQTWADLHTGFLVRRNIFMNFRL